MSGVWTEDLYLFLSQNQDPLWFDWMIRSQTVPVSPHYTILVSFPHSISGGPSDTDVMPFTIIDEERQLGNLQINGKCKKDEIFEATVLNSK